MGNGTRLCGSQYTEEHFSFSALCPSLVGRTERFVTFLSCRIVLMLFSLELNLCGTTEALPNQRSVDSTTVYVGNSSGIQ